MKLSTILAFASLAVVAACSGGADKTTTTTTTPTTTTTDTGDGDGAQMKDTEVPPDLKRSAAVPMLGGMFGERMAAPAGSAATPPPAGAQALFDQFIGRMTQMATEMSTANGNCDVVASALDSWRVDQVPFMLANFETMKAYVNSMTEQQEQALESRMEVPGMQIEEATEMCSGSDAVNNVMMQIMAELASLYPADKMDDPCGGYDDPIEDPCGGYGDPCGGYGDPCGGYGDPCGGYRDPCGG